VLATEHIKVAAVRVALEGFLYQHGQRVHAAAHVGVAGRNPHPHARRNGDQATSSFVSEVAAAVEVLEKKVAKLEK
jgi:hypothetical protein